MDQQLEDYRQLLMKIMSDYANVPSLKPSADREMVLVFDEKRDHYFLHRIGWDDDKRIWNTNLYVRIRDGKFWIEIDWTEEGIATELMAAGVPKSDIVLAFHHPSMRQYTEFAVA